MKTHDPVSREEFDALARRVDELERKLRLSTVDNSMRGRITFIRDQVAAFYDVAPLALMCRNKHPRLTYIRHIIFLIGFEDAGITQTSMADFFGLSQDSVSYAIARYNDCKAGQRPRKRLRVCNPDEITRVELLREQLRAKLAALDAGAIAGLKETQWSELRAGMELKANDWDSGIHFATGRDAA